MDPKHLRTKQKLFGFNLLKARYELLPLVGVVTFACTMGTAFIFYSLYQKPDVRLKKSGKVSPPWEEVNPEESQKLLTFKTKYQKIPELEQLRKEIGSYKY